jgi:hypothetical protein
MNDYLWTGINLICTGKLQQCVGWLINSRKHQILGFDREMRGKTQIALGQRDRLDGMSRQPVRIRNKR